jgi:hypothetical protein
MRGGERMAAGALALAATIVLAMLAAPPAAAGENGFMDPGDAVPGHPGLTYQALVRQAVPDLALNPDDHQVEGHHFKKPLRHLAGEAYEGDPADPVVLGSTEDKRILVGGKKRIALLADLGGKEGRVENLALLMLFDDEGRTPKLLDAADVGLDKDSVFADQAVLALGAGDAALVTWSEHDDSDISLGGYMVVSPIGDRLGMVAMFGLTSERLCSWEGAEHARFGTAANPGAPYRDIQVTVKAVFTHTGQDGCTDEKLPKAGTHVYGATWRWNAAHRRFEPASSTLGGLDALNKKIFG